LDRRVANAGRYKGAIAEQAVPSPRVCPSILIRLICLRGYLSAGAQRSRPAGALPDDY
jgi:hypothetical protein